MRAEPYFTFQSLLRLLFYSLKLIGFNLLFQRSNFFIDTIPECTSLYDDVDFLPLILLWDHPALVPKVCTLGTICEIT